MKKLTAILIATVLLLACLALPASADEPLTFEIVITSPPYVHGSNSNTFTADIVVHNNSSGHTGANFYVDMPAGVTLYNGDVKATAAEGPVFDSADSSVVFLSGMDKDVPNRISIAYIVGLGEIPLVGDGVVARLTFTLANGASELSGFDVGIGIRQVVTADGVEHSEGDPAIVTKGAAFDVSTLDDHIFDENGVCVSCGYSGGSAAQTAPSPSYPFGDNVDYYDDNIMDVEQPVEARSTHDVKEAA